MRASALCYLLSCLASCALAVHHPLHKHRHNKDKRTEVLIVEEETTVEDIDVTIYLPGPPPEGYGRHPEDWKKEGEDGKSTLTTFASWPKPTESGTGSDGLDGKLREPASNPESAGVVLSAGEASPSSTTAISSAAGDSGSDSGSSVLSGGGSSSSAGSSILLNNPSPDETPSPVSGYSASASTAANSPATTATPGSSVIPANISPASTAASSAAAPSHSGAYPFTAFVVFGDNLSDNGNGSYAHNVAANTPTDVVDGNSIYTFKTWTDGPVAASYLTDLLGVPMTQNFAFGHAWGGSHFGATIDDTMQQSNFSASLADGPWFDHGEFSESCWGAPSAKVQINDYIQSGVNKDALHFLWIGANDMLAAFDGLYGGNIGPDDAALNDAFASNISTKIPDLVSTLFDAGAPYILVANLYPKNLAPIWPAYLGENTTTQWDALGAAISAANTALEAALKALPSKYVDRVIYYDAYAFMSNLYANPGNLFPNIKDSNGWPSFCDGDLEESEFMLSINDTVIDGVHITKNWDYCFTLKHGDEWFWMQYLDPTTHVHQLVAQDMETTISKFPFPAS